MAFSPLSINFNETRIDPQPILQATVSGVETKFKEHEHVRNIKISGRRPTDRSVQSDVLLTAQEKPHSSPKKIEGAFLIFRKQLS